MDDTKYCPVSKKCSGCQLSNLSYDKQLRFKQNELRIHFNRLCKINKITGAKTPLGYRNKAQFVFKRIQGHVKCGIYQSATKTMVLTNSCSLHTKEQNEAALILCKLFDSFKVEPYDFFHHKGVVKSVFIRQSFSTGELMIVIVCDQGKNFPSSAVFTQALSKKLPKLASLILTKHKGTTLTAGENPKLLYGNETITDKLMGLDFIISYNSFFQINPEQTEVLYKTAIEMAELNENDTVLDAYSGTGTIGMICAPHCKKVYSVEVVENAVRDAQKNAKLNNIENIEAVCADSEEYIKALVSDKMPVTCAVLDPPRAGCSRSFVQCLCDLAPEKIVYISCNIDTQLRDIRCLLKNGYSIDRVQGVDMFPYTKHIECVIRLSRITQ